MIDPQVESTLCEKLSYTTVASMPNSEYQSYEQVQQLARQSALTISAPHSPKLMRLFATPVAVLIYHFFAFAPLLVMLAIGIAAVVTSHYVALMGIVTAFLGVVLAAPPLSRGPSILLTFAAIGASIYFAYHSLSLFLVFAGFALANILSRTARALCYNVLKDAALTSEVAFLWLLQNDSLIVQRRI